MHLDLGHSSDTNEAQTCGPLISSQALLSVSHCAPFFKEYKLMKKNYTYIKIQLQECQTDNEEINIRKLEQHCCGLFGAAKPNKGSTILYPSRSPSTVLSPMENCKIQGLFKALE